MTCIFGFGLVCLEETPQVEENADHVDEHLHGLWSERKTVTYRSIFHFVEEEDSRNAPDENEAPLISIAETIRLCIQGNDEHGFVLLECRVEKEKTTASSHAHHDQTVVDPRNSVHGNAIVEAG